MIWRLADQVGESICNYLSVIILELYLTLFDVFADMIRTNIDMTSHKNSQRIVINYGGANPPKKART